MQICAKMNAENTNYVSFLSSEGGCGVGNQSYASARRRRMTEFGAYSWRKRFATRTNKKICMHILAAAVSISILLYGYCFWMSKPCSSVDDGTLVFDYTQVPQSPASPLNDSFPAHIHLWRENHFLSAFSQFTKSHKKTYLSVEEKQLRYALFKSNLYFIHKHNNSGRSYNLAMNKFGDFTPAEFAKMKGLRRRLTVPQSKLGVDGLLSQTRESDLPDSIDWRQRGCVTPVKDQASCGSCWAFSTTGAIEGSWCAKTGQLLNLSEQQLMDCSKYEGNESCDGGLPDLAFDYAAQHSGGLCTETSYPYDATDHESCGERKCKSEVKVKGFYDIPQTENAVKAAILKHGPISAGVFADTPEFMFYKSGVFDADCTGDVNHAVLLVGYGTDSVSGKDFFIMKNSWGEDWGDKGYMYMAQHQGPIGECGVLQSNSYPLVE